MANAHIVNCYIESPKLDKETTIAFMSDLHNDEEGVAIKNIETLIKTLDTEHFDYLAIVGDGLNDVNALKNKEFRSTFLELLKAITHGKLSFYSNGNHEYMTGGPLKWQKGQLELLRDVLSEIPNLIHINNLSNFSLDSLAIREKGYPTSNINIIGFNPEFEFFEGKKERDEEFLQYWNRAIEEHPTPCKDTHFNILMLHALKNYITISKKNKQPLLPGLDFAVGGHYHNGFLPNTLVDYIPFGLGGITPQKQLFKTGLHGGKVIYGTQTHILGPVNGRVENKILNKYFGGPYLLLLHLTPKENNQEKPNRRVLTTY